MNDRNDGEENDEPTEQRRTITILGRTFRLPRSRASRIALGGVLVFLGFLGFLPVLGFWMIPLGLLVLSYEISVVRRLRRRGIVWWERRRRPPPSR